MAQCPRESLGSPESLTFLNAPPKLCSGDKSARIMGLWKGLTKTVQVQSLAQCLPYCACPKKGACCPCQPRRSEAWGLETSWLVHFADLESGEKKKKMSRPST